MSNFDYYLVFADGKFRKMKKELQRVPIPKKATHYIAFDEDLVVFYAKLNNQWFYVMVDELKPCCSDIEEFVIPLDGD